VLQKEKVAHRVRGFLRDNFFHAAASGQVPFEGYEIHVGETLYETGASPLSHIERHGATQTVVDGAVNEAGRVFGTYVHGFFDNDDFRHAFIQAARTAVDLAPATAYVNSNAERDGRIDRLADQLRKSLDMNLLTSWLAEPSGSNHAVAPELTLAV
jgi:adenosylcobyric acid synthase